VLHQRAWESPTPFAYFTLEPDLCGVTRSIAKVGFGTKAGFVLGQGTKPTLVIGP